LVIQLLIIQAPASGASAHASRHAVLAALRNPANWRRAHDCRPAIKAATRAAGLPPATRAFGLWLAEKFKPDGTLYADADRGMLAAWYGISARTLSRHLAALDAAGLIERQHSGRLVPRTGCYQHVVVILAAAEFREHDERLSLTVPKQAAEQRNGQPCPPHTPIRVGSSGSVGAKLPVEDARATEIEQQWEAEREQRWVRDHWPLLAKSRTDVPMLRPGYSDNVTLDPEARARLIGARRPAPTTEQRIAWLRQSRDPAHHTLADCLERHGGDDERPF